MSLLHDTRLWRDIHQSDNHLWASILADWRKVSDKEQVLRIALNNRPQRGTALRLLLLECTDQERMSVFEDLVELACYVHGDIDLSIEVVKCMPRRWVVENIEPIVDKMLAPGTVRRHEEDDYQRCAHLYDELDPELLKKLVDRALRHENPRIRQIGIEYQEWS